MPSAAAIPAGTVTFVFTDIEGSTRLLQALGESYADVTRDHRRLVRAAFGEQGGTEIDTQGDAFFFSFPRARDAVLAAVEAQRALRAHPWPEGSQVLVRMGVHTGEPTVGDEGYLGIDVVRAARISAAGHGGQVLLSDTTRALLGTSVPAGTTLVDLGEFTLKDVEHERIYQVSIDDGPTEFPALKTHRAKTAEETLADRIEAQVHRQIEESFAGESASAPLKLAAVGLGVLVLTIAVVVALVVLLRAVF